MYTTHTYVMQCGPCIVCLLHKNQKFSSYDFSIRPYMHCHFSSVVIVLLHCEYYSAVSSFSSSDGHKSSLRGRRTMPVANVVTLDMFLWRNYLICACCGAPPNVDSRSSDTRWVPGGYWVGTRWVLGGYSVPGGHQVGRR